MYIQLYVQMLLGSILYALGDTKQVDDVFHLLLLAGQALNKLLFAIRFLALPLVLCMGFFINFVRNKVTFLGWQFSGLMYM